MTGDQLQRLIEGGESETLELKKSTASLTDSMKTVCGMLNGDGGTVVFGVTPDGRVVGQAASDETLRDVASQLGKLQPFANVRCERAQLPSGQPVLTLLVPSGPQKPYTFDGRPYVRTASTKSLMPQQEYERRLIARSAATDRWELRPAEHVTERDLDDELIMRTVRAAQAVGRLTDAVPSPRDALLRFGLLCEDGSLRQAAVVLFCREPAPYYDQCGLRLALFRGVTKDEFLDNKQFTGPALRLLDDAMAFLMRHLPIRGRVIPGVLRREDTPLFPPDALREALVNALCHRDYSIGGGAVSVGIYDDRVEIDSAGLLPIGITVEDLLRDHTSKPPNRLIAEVFHRAGLIEKWGRGIEKIRGLCRAAGQPEPEFLEIADAVRVRFLIGGYSPPKAVRAVLSDRQRSLLNLLSDGTPRSRQELIADLPEGTRDVGARQVGNDLTRLSELGLVVNTGRGRHSRWQMLVGGNWTVSDE